jgi:hypothetical protein
VGKWVGRLICFGYLVGFPIVSRQVYPVIKQTTEEWGWSNEFLWAVAAVVNTLTAHLFMGIIFTTLNIIQHPFFEKYKAEPEPWPWVSDYKQWKELMF